MLLVEVGMGRNMGLCILMHMRILIGVGIMGGMLLGVEGCRLDLSLILVNDWVV